MIPGANTKKSADDITSNDRGEDEGIFWCFFQSSTLMHEHKLFNFYNDNNNNGYCYCFYFHMIFSPLFAGAHTSVCLLVSSLEITLIGFLFFKSKLASLWHRC